MCRYLSVFVICTVLQCLVKAQTQEGTPCQTPNNQYGVCIGVYSCKVVTEVLSRNTITPEMRSFVKSLACGYSNNQPLVCCPQLKKLPGSELPVGEEVQGSDEVPIEPGVFPIPPQCGISNASLPKVVGGIPAKLGEFPWLVALGYQNGKNPSQPKWLCGGSLITTQHVLTAGHCVKNRKDLYMARVGELDLYDDNDGAHPVDIAIIKAKVHENYSSTRFTNDIAILTLARSTENIPGVWPICLPWESQRRSATYLNKNPFIAGWGAIYFHGPSSAHLQLATVSVLENNVCTRAFESKSVITEKNLCAGDLKGTKDTCQGDSGGPLMDGTVSKTERAIRFYLIGVVSYGFRCAEPGYPGVYTRVTSYIDWIQQNIN